MPADSLVDVSTQAECTRSGVSRCGGIFDGVPFQLMGGKPENIGSMGDVEKVAKVFVRNELSPLQDRFREVNDWLGMEVIRFKEYTLDNPE